MKFLKLLLAVALFSALPTAEAATPKTISFTAEVWADNWFSLYVNGKKVGEDSVPITTQKSFNSEIIKFSATYPLTIGFIAKDYVQSPSGLEYLGTPNQQIGDGGIIFQIRETVSRKLVAVSDENWKVLVQNIAPLNAECEKSLIPDSECKFKNISVPSTWSSAAFKDIAWVSATVFTAAEVGPKEGYFDITWNSSAKFIWGDNLKLDNVIYLRKKISSATNIVIPNAMSISFPNSSDGKLKESNTCDGVSLSPAINISGIPSSAKSLILIMDTIPGPPRPGETQSGNHYYFYKYNLPASALNFAEGAITPYSPPCSQGPGAKEYRIFAYALDHLLPVEGKYDGATLYGIGEQQALAKSMKTLTYSRA